MINIYFIITGTSRGIGEALTKMLLDDGHTVYGISRGSSNVLLQYKNYFHHNFDLSNTRDIEQLLTEIFEHMKFKEKDMVCLINNAALVEPLKSIEKCQTEDVINSLHTNLISPIVLSSCFIRNTKDHNIRRKIINITSGSGTFPLPDMSIYCTAKAGINMFTRCIGAEQSNKEDRVEIIAVDPGMIDTDMQKTAREMESEGFAMTDFFKDAYSNGKLLSPEELAKNLRNIITNKIETGRIMNYSDL